MLLRRNEFGMFTQDAVVGAMRDLDVAISLTGVTVSLIVWRGA
jgi:hypothetical protein